jgi:hypothetical protein
MKRILLKILIVLAVSLLLVELTGNLSISIYSFKEAKIVDSTLVKVALQPNIQPIYNKLYDVGWYNRSFEDFKHEYGGSNGMKALYSKLSKAKAYTKSLKEFELQYYTPRNDSSSFYVYNKQYIPKKRLKLSIREYFDKRIAYTAGISSFSILILLLIIPELKNK